VRVNSGDTIGRTATSLGKAKFSGKKPQPIPERIMPSTQSSRSLLNTTLIWTPCLANCTSAKSADIGFVVEVGDENLFLVGQPMLHRKHGDVVFTIEGQGVEAIVNLGWMAEHGDFALASGKLLQHLLYSAVCNIEIDAWVGLAEADDEVGKQCRAKRAHCAKLQLYVLHLADRLCARARGVGLGLDGLDVGQHHAPQFGKVGLIALAIEKPTAKLGFERLDGAREGGLGDVANLGSAGEVQLPSQRQEVPDLLHFHGASPPTTAP
jgi:hypothetical protein